MDSLTPILNSNYKVTQIRSWISAFRLRTLPLSISGILVGSGVALYQNLFLLDVFVLAIFTTLSLQILSNLANDYGDGVKGTDSKNRIGPKRALQSGRISARQMKLAIFINVILCTGLIALLVYSAFGRVDFQNSFIFLILGLLSVVAAIKYTVGKTAYGYKALGDLMVFIFFGWLSVIGSFYLYSKTVDIILFLPASALGLFSTGVLNLNNMRDLDSDILSKKYTLANCLGSRYAKIYHIIIVSLALILITIYVCLLSFRWVNILLFLAFIPFVIHLTEVYKIDNPKDFDPQLKVLALSTFAISLIWLFIFSF